MSAQPDDLPADPVDDADESAAGAKPKKAPKPPKPPKKPKPPKAKGKGKGGFNPVLVLVPVALIAAVILAFTLPPTRAILAKTPLKPLVARFGGLPGSGLAAKSGRPTDPVADAKRLSDQVQADQKTAAAKDAQIVQLQSQVSQLSAQPSPAATPAAQRTAAAVSEDVKRVATYWAGMDADKAAAIVKQLPDSYVKLVFSQMAPDAVSDIMSELPAKAAARLTAGDAGDTP